MYWIPVLRKLTSLFIKHCNGCKRLRATPYSAEPTISLRKRSETSFSFQKIGVAYAGQFVTIQSAYKILEHVFYCAYVTLGQLCS